MHNNHYAVDKRCYEHDHLAVTAEHNQWRPFKPADTCLNPYQYVCVFKIHTWQLCLIFGIPLYIRSQEKDYVSIFMFLFYIIALLYFCYLSQNLAQTIKEATRRFPLSFFPSCDQPIYQALHFHYVSLKFPLPLPDIMHKFPLCFNSL